MNPESSGDVDEAREAGRVARARAAAEERARVVRAQALGVWPGFVMLEDLWWRYRRLNATALAGNLAFRIFLWLLPASLMLVAAASLARNAGVDVTEEADEKLGITGKLGTALGTAAEQGEGSRWHAAWIALLGLALASSGLLSALHYAAVQLWEVPPQPPRRRAARAAKLAGSLVVVVTVLVLLNLVRRSNLLVGLAAVGANAVLVGLLLLALFWIMPRRAAGPFWLLPGAIAGGLGYFGLQAYTTIWLPRHLDSLSVTYGTLGIAAAALGYLFLLGLLIVVATLVNVVWWDYHHTPAGPADGDGAGAVAGDPDGDQAAGTSTRVASMRPERNEGVRAGLDDSAVQT